MSDRTQPPEGKTLPTERTTVELTDIAGVGKSGAATLKEAGYKTVAKVADATETGLAKKTGWPKAKARSAIEAAITLLDDTLSDNAPAPLPEKPPVKSPVALPPKAATPAAPAPSPGGEWKVKVHGLPGRSRFHFTMNIAEMESDPRVLLFEMEFLVGTPTVHASGTLDGDTIQFRGVTPARRAFEFNGHFDGNVMDGTATHTLPLDEESTKSEAPLRTWIAHRRG